VAVFLQQRLRFPSREDVMTERRKPGESIDDIVGREMREAVARGLFDDLPGAGKPIPGLDQPYDPNWWVKEKLRRERVSMLPEALRLRGEVERELARILAMRSEALVREAIDALNTRIRTVNASITDGPPSSVVPFDVDRLVERWRVHREPATGKP